MGKHGIVFTGICEHVSADGVSCSAMAWKPGERYCIRHDIAMLIAQAPRKYVRRENREQIRAKYRNVPRQI